MLIAIHFDSAKHSWCWLLVR